MNKLDRLEALARYLIEGTFSRLFQIGLHPSELARYLAEAVEDGQRSLADGNSGRWPNYYQIKLNPADYAALVAHTSHEIQVAELRRLLHRLILEANYRLAGPLEVSLASSQLVPVGRVQITCDYSTASMPGSVYPNTRRRAGTRKGS